MRISHRRPALLRLMRGAFAIRRTRPRKGRPRICPQCANPSYRFDEELFRLIAEAQHRGDPLSREDFRPILNAAAILAKTNTSYAFMSPLGAGTRSELGARILPNGHFRLKLTIGRDSFVISGKCD